MTDRIVFFDLETGGTDPLRHPITQVALLAVDGNWRELEALELKVEFDPAAADPEALKINGWDPEVWKAEALIPSVALRISANFFGRHATVMKTSKRGNPYFVARLAGHNVERFDCPFLVQWFKEANLFCPAACYEPLDTLSLARWASFVAPTKPVDHKLGSLCSWLGIDHQDAHDALGDVRATAKVARILSERLRLGWRWPHVAHRAEEDRAKEVPRG